jgi:hypothetical protein
MAPKQGVDALRGEFGGVNKNENLWPRDGIGAGTANVGP